MSEIIIPLIIFVMCFLLVFFVWRLGPPDDQGFPKTRKKKK